jgi:large subunit ribosomal protein L15
MKFNELIAKKQKSPKRVGRGISAGGGKTAGRGTKGQGARKSGGVRPGFEGGQMPLYMRIPKLRGFKSHKPQIDNVYTGQLNSIKEIAIDNKTLFKAGLVPNQFSNVKLILKGELTAKKEVKLQAVSTKAKEAIEKAGGSFQQVQRVPRTAAKKTKTSE